LKASRAPISHSASSSSNARSLTSSCNSPLNSTKTNCDSPLRKELSNFNIATPPPKKRQAQSARDTDEDIDDDSSSLSLSRSSRKSLFSKEKICNGYDPKMNKFFTNFPFQIFELFPDRVNFIISNNKIHSKACADNFFLLIENHADQINKTCNNLQYDTFLQGE
jgi:hypothetical protein